MNDCVSQKTSFFLEITNDWLYIVKYNRWVYQFWINVDALHVFNI